MPQLVSDEYKRLLTLAKAQSVDYYLKESPKLSDSEFDAIFNRLKEIEAEFPELKDPTSPTENVGTSVPKEFKHHSKMYSLDNAFSIDELDIFFDKCEKELGGSIEYCLEPKYDGIALNLIYVDGKLSMVLSRGDGEYGENITYSVGLIKNIPNELREITEGVIEIRGECYIDLRSFNSLNESLKINGLKPYMNQRNAAAGIIRNKSNKLLKGLNILSFSPYSIGHYHGVSGMLKDAIDTNSQYEIIDTLSVMFSSHTGHKKITDRSLCRERLEIMENSKKILGIPMDGVVVKVNDLNLQKRLGSKKRIPNHSIAYKFDSPDAITTIIGMTNSLGKTGTITPVALIQPIVIGDVEVSRVNIFNQENIDRLDLRIDSIVTVVRGGDVIPDIKNVIDSGSGEKLEIAKQCPECLSETTKIDSYIVCNNVGCVGKLKRRMEYFVSRQGVDIEGLGPKVINCLVEKGAIKYFRDIFNLTSEDLSLVPWFREKSIVNTLRSIDERRTVPYKVLLTAISIPNVSSVTAEALVKSIPDPKKVPFADKKCLEEIDGVGPDTASSILSYFSDEEKLKDYLSLCDTLILSQPTKKEGIYSGSVFCLTGSFDKGKDHYKNLIESKGGSVVGSLSKKVTHLIVGENPGSKLNKAKNLKINVISLEEFSVTNSSDKLSVKNEIKILTDIKPKTLLDYFKSDSDAAEFFLLHTSGRIRQKFLRIGRSHYSNRELANKWKDNIMARLNRSSPSFFEARQVVQEIYLEMMGRS